LECFSWLEAVLSNRGAGAISGRRRAVSVGRRAVDGRSAYFAHSVTQHRCRSLDGGRVIMGTRR
jgi:hypothetical protein